MSKKAMKLALDALINHHGNYVLSKKESEQPEAAIKALEEALDNHIPDDTKMVSGVKDSLTTQQEQGEPDLPDGVVIIKPKYDEQELSLDNDQKDEWTDEITAHHPLKTKAYAQWDTAMAMVGARHSKGALVELVCWLLQKSQKPKQEQGEPWGACVSGRVFVGALPEHVRKLSEDEGLPIQWLYTTPQPKQEQGEPVAVVDSTISGHIDWLCTVFPKQGTKLYTTPQQRTWVGLTDEEIQDLMDVVDHYNFPEDLIVYTQAKLREKNT